jgi:hypothetical protein
MEISKEENQTRAKTIIDDYGGIYPVFEAFYIQSILYAAERAEAAFTGFDQAVNEDTADEKVFALVQEGLTHAAALSRFFWPMGREDLSKARGAKLRSVFGLDDTPLKQRYLRNAIEHFDEDLDKFLLGDVVGYFFPTPIVGDYNLADEETGHIFKLVDPIRGICVLLGKKFDFNLIRVEVQRVLEVALEMDRQGSRLKL